MKVLWGGSLFGLPACDYIYNLNPGMVPFVKTQFGCVGDKCEKALNCCSQITQIDVFT